MYVSRRSFSAVNEDRKPVEPCPLASMGANLLRSNDLQLKLLDYSIVLQRNNPSYGAFKDQLYKFLPKVPDLPSLPNYPEPAITGLIILRYGIMRDWVQWNCSFSHKLIYIIY